MPRLSTRSRATAEHIAARKPFTTSGAMYGETVDRPRYLYNGYLRGLDAEQFSRDLADRTITYVVWSYSTPIAWYREPKGDVASWHIVAQSFSVTTSKHQGNLYLCTPRGNGDRGYNPTRRWCGMRGGVNQGYDVLAWPGSDQVLGHADTRDEADFLAQYIHLNGLPPKGTSMAGIAID